MSISGVPACSALEAVDAHVVGLQRQRRRDLRQHVGPARQLERFVALGQLPAWRRATCSASSRRRRPSSGRSAKSRYDAPRGEHDRAAGHAGASSGVHAGVYAKRTPRSVSGPRAGPSTRCHVSVALSGRRARSAPAAGRARRSWSAASTRTQQRQRQRAGEQAAADREVAHARAAARAQFGDALASAVGPWRRCVRSCRAVAHRSAPMLR